MKKKVNSKQSKSSSRERIVKAAVQLFARHGFAGTGLRELASAAGVNLAMINYFFGSKKELLKEILDTFLAGYLDLARRELTGNEELEVRLDRFVRSAVTYFASHRDYLLVTITELPHDDPEIIEYKATWGRQIMEIMEKEVCRHLSTHTGERISPVVIGPILTSMMASRFLFAPVMEQVRPEQEGVLETGEYQEIISRIILRGLMDLQSDYGVKEMEKQGGKKPKERQTSKKTGL
ncbi:TetR/AcrR family transcriptional regulator [Desulfolithobacter sp.]